METLSSAGLPDRASARVFTADVLAMFAALTTLQSFNRSTWPHHRAFYELATCAPAGGQLRERAGGWEFAPSDDGLYAIRDLGVVLWHLSAEGWLRREDGCYRISEAIRARGHQLIDQLPEADRRALRDCACQWTTWSKMASNTSS